MRIYGNPDRALANLGAGRRRRCVKARAFLGDPIRPPERGTKLKTLRITDHVQGISYVVTLHQGDRLNNIEPRLFGRPFVRTLCCGFDRLFRELRRRWKLRWLACG